MLQSAAHFWKGEGIGNFILSAILGILLFALVIKVTEYLFIEEIQLKKQLIKQYSHKKVYSPDGKELGKVSRVLLDDCRFLGIKVGKKKFMKEELLPFTEKEPESVFLKA